jgi:hypothetical protein
MVVPHTAYYVPDELYYAPLKNDYGTPIWRLKHPVGIVDDGSRDHVNQVQKYHRVHDITELHSFHLPPGTILDAIENNGGSQRTFDKTREMLRKMKYAYGTVPDPPNRPHKNDIEGLGWEEIPEALPSQPAVRLAPSHVLPPHPLVHSAFYDWGVDFHLPLYSHSNRSISRHIEACNKLD